MSLNCNTIRGTVKRGIVKSLKRRSVFIKARYSARCSSSLCLKPCHASSGLGSPLCRWPCYHRWISRGVCPGALDLERSNGGERQERWKSWAVVWAWTFCRVQASFHAPSVALEWAATVSSLMAASTRCTRNAVGSSAWQRTLITDVHGARELQPLEGQTTEGSPSRTWQAGGSSFLFLPRRHALSSQWLWNFYHSKCENGLEKIQGAATTSLFPPPLFQDSCMPVRLVQRNDKAIISQVCNVTSHCHHQVQWATCAAWHWGSGPHSEGEKALQVWTWTFQWCSQDSLWHTGWWKGWTWEAQDDMEAADREGLQWVEALSYRPSW